MKKLILLLALVFIGCSSEDEAAECCGTVTNVENISDTQWKYTVQNECTGESHTFESRVEKLTVGMRTCN